MTDKDPDANLDILDSRTTAASSAVVLASDRTAIVELDPDHPGFTDKVYRARRNAFAQLAVDHIPGTPAPEAPYEAHEHEVWRSVWESLGSAHERHACREYLDKAAYLDLPRDHIPQLREVSRKIQSMSGFRLEPVGGLVHPKVFLSTLGDDVFLSTQYIRHHSTPLYTPEPDVVHELVGHAAMLASPTFTELTRLVGAAAKRTRTDEAMLRLGRVYWFTVEFGVLMEEGTLKAYGAGILSSAGELEHMHVAELKPFDLEEMEQQDYDVTTYQPVLFCAESFAEMDRGLRRYAAAWTGE